MSLLSPTREERLVHTERYCGRWQISEIVTEMRWLLDQIRSVDAENAQLREALQRLFDEVNAAEHWLRDTEAFEAARAALEGVCSPKENKE